MSHRVEPVLALDSAKQLIVTESVRLCTASAGDRARAIVLTGSMSRGEATLKRNGRGWRVLGDATFVVVFDSPFPLAATQLQQQIKSSLFSKGIACDVVIMTCTAADLRKMRPSIYAFEVRERGRVVWGDENALNLMPRLTANDIPKEDGWWLLCNRMIEQLEAAANANNSANSTALQYRIAKLYLAMAGCYLLMIGQYEPTYRQRAARLQKLADFSQSLSPIPLQRFSRLVSQCTELKLDGEVQASSDALPQWNEAIADTEMVWRWTLAELTGTNPRESRSRLLAKLASRQSLFSLAKGWTRAAYVSPSALRQNWLRWATLAISMSPRYLVYSAGSELLFAAPGQHCLAPEQLGSIVGLLPLPPESNCQLTWRLAAEQIAYNFHLFVDSTRS